MAHQANKGPAGPFLMSRGRCTMNNTSKAQKACRFGVPILLALLALDARASTWCWKEGLLDVFEVLPAEGCPLSHIEVRMCGVQMPIGNLIITPASMDCPPHETQSDMKTPALDWRHRTPPDNSPVVVFVEGAAPTGVEPEGDASATSRATKQNDGILRGTTTLYNVPLGPAPSSFDRQVGKFVGLLGIAAIGAVLTAAWRFGRRRFRAVPAVPVASVGAVTKPPGAALDDLYVRALDELDSGKPDRAAWARALGESAGNDKAAQSAYIKARVSQLADTQERAVRPEQAQG